MPIPDRMPRALALAAGALTAVDPSSPFKFSPHARTRLADFARHWVTVLEHARTQLDGRDGAIDRYQAARAGARQLLGSLYIAALTGSDLSLANTTAEDELLTASAYELGIFVFGRDSDPAEHSSPFGLSLAAELHELVDDLSDGGDFDGSLAEPAPHRSALGLERFEVREVEAREAEAYRVQLAAVVADQLLELAERTRFQVEDIRAAFADGADQDAILWCQALDLPPRAWRDAVARAREIGNGLDAGFTMGGDGMIRRVELPPQASDDAIPIGGEPVAGVAADPALGELVGLGPDGSGATP